MTSSKIRRIGALLVAASLVAAACGGDDDTSTPAAPTTTAAAGGADTTAAPAEEEWDGEYSTGINDTDVFLAANGPLSGPASAYGAITNTYPVCADYVNDTFGGVTMKDGKTRTLHWEIFDDGYSAERTVQNFRRMNEELEIFAAVGTLGTPPNTAIIDYSDEEQFPNIFVATGATRWGRDFGSGDYPWTIGWQPTYSFESNVYAQYLEENHPGSTVAVLQANDDYGKDYFESFEKAIEGTSITIARVETYTNQDPDVTPQMIALAATNADVFYNITTPRFAVQAIVAMGTAVGDWSPIHLLNNVSASTAIVLTPAAAAGGKVNDIISTVWFKDPTDPAWADDPGMMRYREIFGKYGPALNLDDSFTTFGWSQCELIRQVLENSYPNRESLMNVVGNLQDYDIEIDILPDGVKPSTGPGQGFPLRAMQVVKFNGTYFERQGEPIISE
jgi:branched-chain amino acid transport system substrate-binding protein